MRLLFWVLAVQLAAIGPLVGGIYLAWEARGRPCIFFTRWIRAMWRGEVH